MSDILSVFKIVINKCDASVDPYCVNSTAFSDLEKMFDQFSVVVPVVNVQMNPSSMNYKTQYL